MTEPALGPQINVVLVHGALEIGRWMTEFFLTPADAYEVDGTTYEVASYREVPGLDGRPMIVIQVTPQDRV